MGEIAANSDALLMRLVRRSRAAGLQVVEAHVLVHVVAHRLHARPALGNPAERGPRELHHPIHFAIPARDQELDRVVWQILDSSLYGGGIPMIRLAAVFEHGVVPEADAAGRRRESTAAIAEAVDVFADFHRRVQEQVFSPANRGLAMGCR